LGRQDIVVALGGSFGREAAPREIAAMWGGWVGDAFRVSPEQRKAHGAERSGRSGRSVPAQKKAPKQAKTVLNLRYSGEDVPIISESTESFWCQCTKRKE